MAPKMSVVRKLLLGSPASFKQQRKSEAARSSTPYKICSSRKATNLPPKPTRHRAKRLEAANQLPWTTRRTGQAQLQPGRCPEINLATAASLTAPREYRSLLNQ